MTLRTTDLTKNLARTQTLHVKFLLLESMIRLLEWSLM